MVWIIELGIWMRKRAIILPGLYLSKRDTSSTIIRISGNENEWLRLVIACKYKHDTIILPDAITITIQRSFSVQIRIGCLLPDDTIDNNYSSKVMFLPEFVCSRPTRSNSLQR